MADELTISISLSFSKGGAVVRRAFSGTIDVSGGQFQHSVQTVGTVEEALSIHSDVGAIGYVFIQNLDSTNYIQIGPATGRTDFRLLAGEATIFRLDTGTTIYVKANTAQLDVEYIVLEP